MQGEVHGTSQPGVIQYVQWMAKVLYAVKMWMFRSQFKLTAMEETGVR